MSFFEELFQFFVLFYTNPLLHRYSFQHINNRQLLKRVGKEEIARNKQFLLFPQCFLLNEKIVSPFVNNYDIISLFAAELEEPKIGVSGTGLKNKSSRLIFTNYCHFL